MRLLIFIVVFLVADLATVQGRVPNGKTVKSSVNQLNWLEKKMLIRKFHPNMNLDKILTFENRSSNKDNDRNPIKDEYGGSIETFNVELPLLLLQLVKMGDDIPLPSFHWEYEDSSCYLGSCGGFIDIFDIINARLKTVTKTSLHASMNGSQFQVEFKIPDLEIQCPECALDSTTYGEGEDPPTSADNVYFRGYSLFVKNYSLIMTCNVGWNVNRIELTDLDLTWEMDELWDRLWNATHTFPNGTKEEWGSQDDLMHERLLEEWSNGRELEYEQKISEWLNCYLSEGRNNNENCTIFFKDRLHYQTAAEILHTFGLAALNNYRASQEDAPGAFNLKAEPMDTMNTIIFEFVTHVIQTGKYATALFESTPFPLQRPFTLTFNREVCTENSVGNAYADCENLLEQVTIGGPMENGEYSTELHGAANNTADVSFGRSTASYRFVVRNMTLSSSDFQRISTDVNTGNQYVYTGLTLNIFNCSVGFIGDYYFEDGFFYIYILKLQLFMDKVTMDIPNVVASENGQWIDLPSIHKDAAPMVMELWEGTDQHGITLEERYRVFLQDKINYFLTGRIQV